MKVVIDTSSLISLVRYYLPFDKNAVLFKYVKAKIERKEILVLDKVFLECRYTSRGIVLSALKYLNSKAILINTTNLLPDAKFFNLLENNFINGSAKNKLTDAEFENRKRDFLDSADAKLLLYSLKNKHEKIIVVSEETETSNDNKSFKKLPAICKILEIEILTLPDLLDRYDGINLEFR